MADLVLVLGGTRSGKSVVAESLVEHCARVVYVATARAEDDEMRRRVEVHRRRRPSHWSTVETADLAGAVADAPAPSAVLVDGLGVWLAARMDDLGLFGATADDGAAACIHREVESFVDAVRRRDGGDVVVVGEEAGLGVVPADRGTRRWVDLLGAVVQQLSGVATQVLLVHAGRAVELPAAGTASQHVPASADDLRAHGDTMVPAAAHDFAVNVHGDGPPPHVVAALEQATREAGRYPDPSRATAAIARRHHRPVDEVLPTAGAAEAFWLLAAALGVQRAVVVHPQFTEPEAALRAHGLNVGHVLRSPDDGWALHPRAVPADADLVFVGSPNNPTGTLDDPADLAALCRPGRVTVVDEAFVDFVPDPAAGVAQRRDLPGLVVVRSVTKLWGLAGVRAGYLLAPAGLIRRCGALRQPWAVGAAALAALEVCVDDERYRQVTAFAVATWRDRLVSALRAIPGVTVWPAAANFVLIHVDGGAFVYRALLDAGVAVRPSTFPGLGPDYLRVAVRAPEQTDVLLAALRHAVSENAI